MNGPTLAGIIVTVVGLLGFAAVWISYVRRPMREALDWSRRLREARVESDDPLNPASLFQTALRRQWLIPVSIDQLRGALVARFSMPADEASLPPDSKALTFAGIRRSPFRENLPHPRGYHCLTLRLEPVDAHRTHLHALVLFRFGPAMLLNLALFLGVFLYFHFLAGRVVALAPYMPAVASAIIIYSLASMLACWPGQLIVTRNFLDQTILQSTRPS